MFIVSITKIDVIKHPIESFRNLRHAFKASIEKKKYNRKVKKFKLAGNSKFPTVKILNESDESKKLSSNLKALFKKRKWPDDFLSKKMIIEAELLNIGGEKKKYPITDMMRVIERDFNLSNREKHHVYDDVKSLIKKIKT
jgi:hypothetical protein